MSASKGKLTLLNNVAATGAWFEWRGGRGAFMCEATWGGGTVKLQFKGPNGTAIDVGADTTLTANGGGIFDLPPCEIRANVSVATAVYAIAVHEGE